MAIHLLNPPSGPSSAVPINVDSNTPGTTTTYHCIQDFQTYTVPDNCHLVEILCVGGATGYDGARVSGRLEVTPGQELTVAVGGSPGNEAPFDGSPGWNGGAAQGASPDESYRFGPGAGSTDVRTGSTLSTRLIVAGGAGSGGVAGIPDAPSSEREGFGRGATQTGPGAGGVPPYQSDSALVTYSSDIYGNAGQPGADDSDWSTALYELAGEGGDGISAYLLTSSTSNATLGPATVSGIPFIRYRSGPKSVISIELPVQAYVEPHLFSVTGGGNTYIQVVLSGYDPDDFGQNPLSGPGGLGSGFSGDTVLSDYRNTTSATQSVEVWIFSDGGTSTHDVRVDVTSRQVIAGGGGGSGYFAGGGGASGVELSGGEYTAGGGAGGSSWVSDEILAPSFALETATSVGRVEITPYEPPPSILGTSTPIKGQQQVSEAQLLIRGPEGIQEAR